MINIIFVDKTLENNEIFNKFIREMNDSIFYEFEKLKVISDCNLFDFDIKSINELSMKNKSECLYITCIYKNIKNAQKINTFPLLTYHYIPFFNSNDLKNIKDLLKLKL